VSVVLRRLGSNDAVDEAAKLFDAYRQFYKQQSDLESARIYLSMRIKTEQSVVFLAEQNGAAIGFMQLYPSFCSIALAPIWVLYDLFVTPEARGTGTATALLSEARRFGRASGAAYLQLTTAHDNHTAQRVYEANGWQLATRLIVKALAGTGLIAPAMSNIVYA
jgi:GNAT superfamily N-acetyltransferase